MTEQVVKFILLIIINIYLLDNIRNISPKMQFLCTTDPDNFNNIIMYYQNNTLTDNEILINFAALNAIT